MEATLSLQDNGNVTETAIVTEDESRIEAMKLANRIVMTVAVLIIMLAMGCIVTLEDFKVALKRPTGVAIGFASQFGILPLVAFTLAHILKLEAPYAIGMLIIACCPGGVTSQLFTYWSDGDVCLSICMTTISTVAATGMMPLCLWIYSRSWTDETAVIPYTSIIISLTITLIPVVIGMFIRRYRKGWTRTITMTGSIMGFLAIASCIVLNGLINPKMFLAPWTVWFASVILTPIAFLLGYVLAYLLRQSRKKCRTIALETGLQNVALALTIIIISYDDNVYLYEILIFPSLFGITVLITSFLCVAVFRQIEKRMAPEEGSKPISTQADDINEEEHV